MAHPRLLKLRVQRSAGVLLAEASVADASLAEASVADASLATPHAGDFEQVETSGMSAVPDGVHVLMPEHEYALFKEWQALVLKR